MKCFWTKEICVFNFWLIYKPFVLLKFIQITSAFLLPFSLYGACSYFFSVSYAVFSYVLSHTAVYRADGQNGALIIGSAGCTVHATSGPGGICTCLTLSQTQPFYTVKKNAQKFSCILLARVSLSWEAVHIADELICIGHVASCLSVTLMTLWLGFSHDRGVYVEVLNWVWNISCLISFQIWITTSINTRINTLIHLYRIVMY